MYFPRPPTTVRPVVARVTAMVPPRSTKYDASVTMKDGRPVFTTITPLSSPMRTPNSNASSTAAQTGSLITARPRASSMPVAPTVEPTERSNCPEIMSRETEVPTMPIWAETSRMPAIAATEKNPLPAPRIAKIVHSSRNPRIAPTSAGSSPPGRRRRSAGVHPRLYGPSASPLPRDGQASGRAAGPPSPGVTWHGRAQRTPCEESSTMRFASFWNTAPGPVETRPTGLMRYCV